MNDAINNGLRSLLSDTYLLTIKTQNYHWNVTGPNFGPLHTLFDTQYAELATANDLIAERIRALGAHAPGSCGEFNLWSKGVEEESITGEPAETADEMIADLAHYHEEMGSECRNFLEKLDEHDDEVTAQLVADRALAHDKAAWFLSSHLEKSRKNPSTISKICTNCKKLITPEGYYNFLGTQICLDCWDKGSYHFTPTVKHLHKLYEEDSEN